MAFLAYRYNPEVGNIEVCLLQASKDFAFQQLQRQPQSLVGTQAVPGHSCRHVRDSGAATSGRCGVRVASRWVAQTACRHVLDQRLWRPSSLPSLLSVVLLSITIAGFYHGC
jgi:hypothetical protein